MLHVLPLIPTTKDGFIPTIAANQETNDLNGIGIQLKTETETIMNVLMEYSSITYLVRFISSIYQVTCNVMKMKNNQLI